MFDIVKEIEFWTHIMRDHALFQHTGLSPRETETINKTQHFYNLFDQLHQNISKLPAEINPEIIPNLLAENKTAVVQFTQFKKKLLEKLMSCRIELAMSPSFLNHMINEAMEYYRFLCIADESLRYNKVLENIRLHKVWLPDASGHAKYVASQLDGIEGVYYNEAIDFMHRFDEAFKKANEMYLMYERITRRNGELEHFNTETEMSMNNFIVFLETVRQLKKECKLFTTGTFSPLILDHMIREEKYYLTRIKCLTEK